MIKKLSIRNFKSIKDLEIDCRRVNLFIGEPNAGKSNILEALGLLSWFGNMMMNKTELGEYVRIQGTHNLFYDGLLDQTVEIGIENSIEVSMKIKFENDRFHFIGKIPRGEEPSKEMDVCWLDYSPQLPEVHIPELEFIKFYRFVGQNQFPRSSPSFLMPPHGSNMFALVMGNEKLRRIMSKFFKEFGLYPVLKPQEKTIEVQKSMGDITVDYPYILAPDTLQRIMFYIIAIESNENSTLVFEPESHAFPYYTGLLGEIIASDEKNQYFLTTHNPYFLLSILERTPKNDVNACITYFKDNQTKVKRLNDEEVSRLMKYDPFFNLESFIEEEER